MAAIKSQNSSSNQKMPAQEAFSTILTALLKQARQKVPSTFKDLRAKTGLTVLDVGCGYFRYGKALHSLLLEINPNIRLFAVDRQKYIVDYSPATFIKCDITKCQNELKKNKITDIDIFTVFNPFPGIPDLTNIPVSVQRKALLIGCVDWNSLAFRESLAKNGFKALLWQENRFWNSMRPWFNNYDPFVFAVKNNYQLESF